MRHTEEQQPKKQSAGTATVTTDDRLPEGFTLHANGMLTGPADWAGTPAGELLEQAVAEIDLWDILRARLSD